MGICRYCGQPAGFLKQLHRECEEREEERKRLYQAALDGLRDSIFSALVKRKSFDVVESKIKDLKQKFPISDDDVTGILVEGWTRSLDHFLDDRVLDTAEEKLLLQFAEHFPFPPEFLIGRELIRGWSRPRYFGTSWQENYQ